MIIAVTGGLGTGKSTVSKIFATTLASELVDTDQLCRRQLAPGREGYDAFRRQFHNRFIQDDGLIDRRLLRQAVFEEDALREQLENILHPIVQDQVATLGLRAAVSDTLVVVEVPLLYEVGWQDAFDFCIVVYVPEKICLERVMARDQVSAAHVRQILQAQIPIKKKLAYADFIVDNSGTFVSTVQQIAWVSRKLKMESKHGSRCAIGT